jgi:alpha-beta hydrolase superfamily lysophospholipase
LYIHGAEDPLVPVSLARPVVQRLAGQNSEVHIRAGARHEVFNEIDKVDVIALVAQFVSA